MGRIRFVIVGSGWRSMFYVRIAKALPEQFEVCAMLCRTEEKARRIGEEHKINTTTSIEQCIELVPDFVIVAVNKASIYDVTRFWLEKGFPVLSETPPSLKLDELKTLWELSTKFDAKIQVAEQYFKYPTYEAQITILDSNIIGPPYNVTISAVHDYHAASLIRKILHTGFEKVSIYGKKYLFPVTETESRYEIITDGRVADKERVKITMEFESGKVAFYDFSSIQYRSAIRNRHLIVQGIKGELTDSIFYYLNEKNLPQIDKLQVNFDADKREVETITFKDQIIYKPALGRCGLTEDETAIAVLLQGMKEYVQTGKEIYPFADALQDAYITILMEEALKSPNATICSEKQPWCQ
jgi:predicted dehydrogenase